MTMLRLVTGRGEASANDILTLAIRVAQAAVANQLRLVEIKASRNRGSCSRYVHLLDRHGRAWLIRVSNHRMPAKNWQPVPHLDLVSLDGTSGAHEAGLFLNRVGMGAVDWFDPHDRAERAALRKQRKVRR